MIYRKNELLKLAKNKNVLHLGCIHHADYQLSIESNTWLHKDLDKVSKKLVGLDYLKKETEEIHEKYGYEIYFADVMKLENVDIQETFDLIICGELINHIENPGLMLKGLRRFMNRESLLIITTPNQYSLHRMIKIFLGKEDAQWIHPEVVAWHSFGTLRHLTERCSFFVERQDYYVDYEHIDAFKNRVKRVIPAYLQDGLFAVIKIL